MPNWNEEFEAKGLPSEGKVTAELVHLKLDKNKDGDPVLGLMYSVEGANVWQNFTFNDKGKKFITWQLGLLGVIEHLKTKTGIVSWDDSATAAYNFLLDKKNTKCDATITHDTFNGQTRAKITLKQVQEDFHGSVAPSATATEDSLPF